MAHLVGPGLIGAAGPTSQTWTTPFPHKPGDKARDKFGNEYVFVEFITTNVSGGVLVQIDATYRAFPLLGTARVGGRVGVAMTGATAATDGGWVQIYGVHLAVQSTGAADSDALSSDQTVDYILRPQTSVTTPSGTLGMVLSEANTSIEASTNYTPIYGMWLVPDTEVSNIPDAFWTDLYSGTTSPVSAVSNTSGPVTLTTATTNGTSMHTGNARPVFLNYPYVTGIDVETPMVNATT